MCHQLGTPARGEKGGSRPCPSDYEVGDLSESGTNPEFPRRKIEAMASA